VNDFRGQSQVADSYKRILDCQPVLVQSDGFRCMAYRDKEGKWRDYYHQDELTGNVKLVETFD